MNVCTYPFLKTSISLFFSFSENSYSKLVTALAIPSVATVYSSLSSSCLLPACETNVYLSEPDCVIEPGNLKSLSTIRFGGKSCLPFESNISNVL